MNSNDVKKRIGVFEIFDMEKERSHDTRLSSLFSTTGQIFNVY